MNSASKEEFSLLASARDLSFIAGLYLFYLGFTFAKSYYEQLGIPINEMNIPIQHFLVYAATIVLRSPNWMLLIAGLSFALLWSRRWRVMRILLSATLLFVLWHVATKEVVLVASEEVRFARSGITSKTVNFVFKPEVEALIPPELKEKKLKLVAQSGDAFYVIDQVTSDEPVLPSAHIYRVRKDFVAFIHMKIN